MKTNVFNKGAFLIAGVLGSGDETGKVWEAFMKIQKINPLKNQVGEEGYEVRMYPAEGPGKIHVGVRVKDSNVPKEYKLFFVPAATYAEFVIYPAKGYESSNEVMNKWLEDNAERYRSALINGLGYGIEVYDQRFKGDSNPESVVSFWQPIEPVSGEFDPAQMILGPLNEFCRRVEQFADPGVSKKVLQGKDEMLAAKDPVKGSVWMKEAIDRLDELTDKKTRIEIMSTCGKSCNAHNFKDTEECRQMRNMCASEEEYLEKFLVPPGHGVCNERDGNKVIQYYTPRDYGKSKYGKGIRCYCSLVNMLPEGINASPTYCQCSRAFVQAHWEAVLGRPVKVELEKTAISGADECKFIIYL